MESKGKSFKSGPQSLRVGIDLVEVKKIRETLEQREALQESVFTSDELSYASQQKNPYNSLAALFAAKEAVFKALGTGLSGEMDWREVEVEWGGCGRAVLRLCGRTASVADEMGVVQHALSLSRTREYGMAVVVLTAIASRTSPKE